jgi:hypothetical protein
MTEAYTGFSLQLTIHEILLSIALSVKYFPATSRKRKEQTVGLPVTFDTKPTRVPNKQYYILHLSF